MSEPIVWSDIAATFDTSKGDFAIVENVNSILQSIVNILLTRQGERVMKPSFGTGIYDLIFENFSAHQVRAFIKQIEDQIKIWDDRIILHDIITNFEPDTKILNLSIIFALKGREKEILKASTIVQL